MRIAVVPPDDRPAAVELLFAHLPVEEQTQQAEAFCAEAAAGRLPWSGLLGAYHDERLAGAAVVQLQAGRTASVWLPRAAVDAPPATADELWQAVCAELDARGVRLAQVLVEHCDESDEQRLRRWGFGYLTDLLYLVCRNDQFPAQPPDSPLTFQPYRESDRPRLAAIVEQTYGDTLDCPALNNVRPIDEVLESYRATGVFDPRRWLIVGHGAAPVGCLLLADHPQIESLELVYMGVVPSARGAGWGAHIVRHAQWLAAEAGRARLILAVDVQNAPAVGQYAAAGFQAWQRRRVYVRVAADCGD